MRTAFAIQRFKELNARGGSRYIETILNHFGVISEDSRLQRPEYLGGGKTPIVISEVLQTSETNETPQGTMAGHGISVGNTNQFSKYFPEHGYVFGLLSILPRTVYQQSIPKTFLRDDKYDFFWPVFAHLGEQAIENRELYFDLTTKQGMNKETFGYQSRYSDYRYIPSTCHGDMRSTTGTLGYWHFGRKFSSKPVLSSDFIECNPTYAPFAVTSTEYDHFIIQVYNNIKAIRPMPFMADPGLIDH